MDFFKKYYGKRRIVVPKCGSIYRWLENVFILTSKIRKNVTNKVTFITEQEVQENLYFTSTKDPTPKYNTYNANQLD